MSNFDAKLFGEALEFEAKNPLLARAIAEIVFRRGSVSEKQKVGLTTLQKQVLDFITEYIATHDGISPTYDEIMRHFGLHSKSGVNRLIRGLEERGHIVRIPNKVRSISIV